MKRLDLTKKWIEKICNLNDEVRKQILIMLLKYKIFHMNIY